MSNIEIPPAQPLLPGNAENSQPLHIFGTTAALQGIDIALFTTTMNNLVAEVSTESPRTFFIAALVINMVCQIVGACLSILLGIASKRPQTAARRRYMHKMTVTVCFFALAVLLLTVACVSVDVYIRLT